MSYVQNVILSFSIMENEPARIADVNRLVTICNQDEDGYRLRYGREGRYE